jgi:hypothetical protein
MKLIPLSQGLFAQVDDDDYEKANKFKWYALVGKSTVYAERTIRKIINGIIIKKHLRLHRYLLNISSNKIEVDHKDGNGLNCQRYNMRKCTHQENLFNTRKTKRNTSSIYKGVSYRKDISKWFAQININKKRNKIGYFEKEIEAARAYNKKAKELFGEFAYLNEI